MNDRANDIKDLERRLALAMRQWDHWKLYALEMHDRLQKYEPGPSVMLLNAAERTAPNDSPLAASEATVMLAELRRWEFALRTLRNAVIEQNRAGTSWHPHVFGPIMDGLGKAAELLGPYP